MNYNEAKDILKNKATRKVDNNTYLVNEGDYIGLKLHDTYVIKFYKIYNYLFTGGWLTNTTKDRINKYSGITVNQKNNIWYIGENVFFEGIKIKNGEIIGKKINSDKKEKQVKKLKTSIDKYLVALTKKLNTGLEKPSGGDCWYCSMFGGITDTDHLKQHIKEKYIVPSLILNAVKEARYGYPAFIIGWNNENELSDARITSFEAVNRAVRKYLLKRLL
jgi:hypothetical protein